MFVGKQCSEARATSSRAALVALCFVLGCAHAGPVERGLPAPRMAPKMAAPPIVEGETATERRVALVIGNQNYLVQPLKNPGNDARAMAEALTEIGFEVISRVDANLADMRLAVKEFKTRLQDTKGLGLFYYSGHGIQRSDHNFLVPVDALLEDATDVAHDTLSADEVLSAMEGARSGTNVVLLDACRNDPFPSNTKEYGRGLARMDPSGENLFAFATSPGKTASDGEGMYGVWTGALLRHIREPGLEMEQFLRRATFDVKKETNGAQTPWTATNWSVTVIVHPGKPAEAQELLRLASEDFDSGDYLGTIRDIEQALDSEHEPLSPRQRDEAEMLRKRAQDQLAYLRFLVEPHSAMVRIDSSTRFSRDGVMELNPGLHHVQISDDGYRGVERSIELAAGSVQDMRVTLERGAEKPQRAWLPWTLGGVAVGAIAASATTWALSGKSERRLNKRCGADMTCPDSFDWHEVRRQGRALAVTGDVLLGVSLAAASSSLLVRYWPNLFGARADRALAGASCAQGGCSVWGKVAY